MKTLTIKQPFASLIAEGYKEYEFRVLTTNYRGDILIHAGKSIDKKAMMRYEYLNLKYPTGKIIAKATITDCIPINSKMKKYLEDSLIYYEAINRDEDAKPIYGFKLENVEKIDPIAINGKLSFWEFDYDKNKKIS